MPVIKARANRVRSARHICHLQEPNRDALVLYSRFIGDSVDYVVNQLIATTLLKDRDFVTWRQEHPDEVVTHHGRTSNKPQRSHRPSRV